MTYYERPMEKEAETLPPTNGTLAFVLNQMVIEAKLPYELAPDCFIDKATEEQRERIKSTLNGNLGTSSWIRPSSLYECETICKKDGSGTKSHQQPLTESEWRYYVVSTPDNGLTSFNLHLASNISDTPLELSGLYFHMSGGAGERTVMGTGTRLAILQNQFSIPVFAPAKRVSRECLDAIREIYSRFVEFADGIGGVTPFPEIQRAMQMYDSLNLLLENSDFHVLGLFAIIEMLITHNPKLEDRGDTITHQMQSKIPLLSHRFERALDYASFFPNRTEKKIWAALYKYRSALAHGGTPDFQDADLRVLTDANNAKAFLRETVKALLRHSLKEPLLYKDLRAC